MQVRKVAVVATGALATAAAMGWNPAQAEDSASAPDNTQAAVGVLGGEVAQQARDDAMREMAGQWLTVTPEGAWSAPWDQDPPQILSVASGSAVSAASLQSCGSSVMWGLGLTAPVASPNTVLGDCANGNIAIQGDGEDDDALFSLLDNTALSALPVQTCGSSQVIGVGGAVPIASPNTVTGSCANGNISVDTRDEPSGYGYDHGHAKKKARGHQGGGYGYDGAPGYDYGYDAGADATVADATTAGATGAGAGAGADEEGFGTSAPWEYDPPQILSAGSGSAVSAASLQSCGSSVMWGVGGTVPLASPNTVLGDCANANIDIHGDGGDALFSLLDSTAVSVLPVQTCGSSQVIGVGGAVPIASPNTVTGSCANGNISVDER